MASPEKLTFDDRWEIKYALEQLVKAQRRVDEAQKEATDALGELNAKLPLVGEFSVQADYKQYLLTRDPSGNPSYREIETL
jgi:hypothetical protein